MQQQLPAGNEIKRGFTVIEIMTVVIIVSLLITAAIPGYENFVRNNQAFVLASRLEASLRLAQGEAIRLGIPVTVCPITNFDPTGAFVQDTEQYPCDSGTTWNAWKVFQDPNFDATEDFSNGWPIIQYVGGDVPTGSITTNIAGPITFDPMGFANLNVGTTRAGWTWSSAFTSGEWQWSYAYNSAYTGSYTDRLFTVVPEGCTGNNARIVDVSQNGVITVSIVDCFGI